MPESTVSNPSVLDDPAKLQQWNTLLESLFGTPATNTSGSTAGTSTSSTSVTSDANDPIKALLAMLVPGATGGIANPQSAALIQNLLTQFKEGAGGLSGIQAAGNSAGVYNSSTQGLLANDAMSRAVAQAAGVLGTQQNQQQQIIAQLLATLSAGSRTTNQVGATTGTTQSSSSKGGSLGSGGAGAALKAGAGAAAAAQALKAIKDATANNASAAASSAANDKAEDDAMEHGAIGSQQGADQTAIQADDTSGTDTSNLYDTSSDPAAFFGTEDAGANGFSDPGNTSESDPSGVGGYDIGDFVQNDNAAPNFDFVDNSGTSDNTSGDTSGDSGDGGDIPDFTGGDY